MKQYFNMIDCLFCKIVKKELKVNILFENSDILAFNDINPQAPLHILVIPKIHIATLNDLKEKHSLLLGNLIFTASMLAKKFKVSKDGYRTIFNCNNFGGQTIYHIHLHLLARRQLSWPPG